MKIKLTNLFEDGVQDPTPPGATGGTTPPPPADDDQMKDCAAAFAAGEITQAEYEKCVYGQDPNPEPEPEPPTPPTPPGPTGPPEPPAPTPEEEEEYRKQKRELERQAGIEAQKKQHADFLERTRRRQEKDALIRQGEIDAAQHRARMARLARSSRNVFYEHTLRFKPNSLKELLNLTEQSISPLPGTENLLNAGKSVIDIGKGISKLIKPTLSPKESAKAFLQATTPHAADSDEQKFVKDLFRYSPATFARIQANRAAAAAAFTPENEAEKIKHYATIIKSLDPINLAGKIADVVGGVAQSELRNRMYGWGGRGLLGGVGLGLIAPVASAAETAKNIVEPYLDAKALQAGKLIYASQNDWRTLTR